MITANDVFKAMASGKTDTTLLSGEGSFSGASVYRHAWEMAVGLPDLTGCMTSDLVGKLLFKLSARLRRNGKLTDTSLDEILKPEAFKDSGDFCDAIRSVRKGCDSCLELQVKLKSIKFKVVKGFEKVVPLPELNDGVIECLLPIISSPSELLGLGAFEKALLREPRANNKISDEALSTILKHIGVKASSNLGNIIKAAHAGCTTSEELQEKIKSIRLFASLILEWYMTPVIGVALGGCEGYSGNDFRNIALKSGDVRLRLTDDGTKLRLSSMDVLAGVKYHANKDDIGINDFIVSRLVGELLRNLFGNLDVDSNIEYPLDGEGNIIPAAHHFDFDVMASCIGPDYFCQDGESDKKSIESLLAQFFMTRSKPGVECAGISDYVEYQRYLNMACKEIREKHKHATIIQKYTRGHQTRQTLKGNRESTKIEKEETVLGSSMSIACQTGDISDRKAEGDYGHTLEQSMQAFVKDIIENLLLAFSKDKVAEIKKAIALQDEALGCLDELPLNVRVAIKTCINSMNKQLTETLDLMKGLAAQGFANIDIEKFNEAVEMRNRFSLDAGCIEINDIAANALLKLKREAEAGAEADEDENAEVARACGGRIAGVGDGSKQAPSPTSVAVAVSPGPDSPGPDSPGPDSPGPGQSLFSNQPPGALAQDQLSSAQLSSAQARNSFTL